jgi:hypothetical protein
MGHERIPALPTVIIAPPTLLSMWRDAVATCLSDNACSTLVYKGGLQARRSFFEDGSQYDQAMKSQFPERTILFVESSVCNTFNGYICIDHSYYNPQSLLADGRSELMTQGDRSAGEPSTGHPDNIAKTIFARESLVVILEEGHLYRNCGRSYATICTVMANAAQRMVLSATPVFTHPRVSIFKSPMKGDQIRC